MKIKKPNTGQLAAIGAVAGLLGLTLGGVALADGLSRDDAGQGRRPYAEVLAEDARETVPPPPAPPPSSAWTEAGPRAPRADHRPRGPEHAAAAAGWGDDDRRGPPPHAGADRKRDRDARRAAGDGEWVWCEYERDGDLDCDEDDRRTWSSTGRSAPPAPPVR